MTEPIAFALACLALLATPGPTNTLLATSGAVAGFSRSTPLIGAELAGYTLSIAILSMIVAPLLDASPVISIALRLACGAYLVWSAVQLWREGSNSLTSGKAVSFQRVFIATLLNPKGVVFALVVAPHLGERRIAEAAPYLIGLAGMMIMVALSWISAGALVNAGAKGRVDAGVIRKVGATVLAVFGVLLSGSVLMAVR